MSREIKFRLWDKAESVMVLDPLTLWELIAKFRWGEALLHNNKDWIDGDGHPHKGLTHVYFGDNPHLVVMQYTGLKDKNGKEIYEGDVVAYPEAVVPHNMVVEWGDYLWEPFFDVYWKKVEVIGNVYENPDLLEGK
jgi:hypothetical protein